MSKHIRQDSKPALFDLCRTVEGLAIEIGEGARFPQDDLLKTFYAAHTNRALTYFQAVVLLCQQSLPGPAAALLRCLVELQFVQEAIRRDPGNLSKLVEHDERLRLRVAKNLKEIQAASSTNEYDAAIAHIELDADGTSKETHVASWANLAGRSAEYKTIYVWLSNHVHAGLRATEEHLKFDASGNLISVGGPADEADIPTYLWTACGSMSKVLLALPHEWLINQTDERLEAVEHKRDELVAVGQR